MPHAEKIGFLHMIKVRSLRKFEFGIASFERQNGRKEGGAARRLSGLRSDCAKVAFATELRDLSLEDSPLYMY